MYFSGPRSVRFHFNSSWLYRSVDPTVVVIPADYLRSGSPPPKKTSRTATMGYLNITWWVVESTQSEKEMIVQMGFRGENQKYLIPPSNSSYSLL